MKESTWHPRKRWGQSFLRDGNIVRKILDFSDLKPEDVVIEVGPGRGALTFLLAKEVKKLIAVEIDPYLAQGLREAFSGVERVDIVEGDVLDLDFNIFASRHGVQRLKVVGNIPYSISGAILFHLLSFRKSISSAILMMQKEVVERLTADPGRREYGLPTVLLAVYGSIRKGFDVSPNCFYPRPQVTSSVVRIDFSPQPVKPIIDELHFQQLVKHAFAHKRKTLINNLLMVYPEISASVWHDLFKKIGLDRRMRAEALTPVQFIDLSNALIRLRRE